MSAPHAVLTAPRRIPIHNTQLAEAFIGRREENNRLADKWPACGIASNKRLDLLIARSAQGPIIWSHGLQGAVEQDIDAQTIKLHRAE
jgi:hypothetical protein